MKKLLAIVISMAMVVAMMPMGVFADDGVDASTCGSSCGHKVSASNGMHYNSLEDAIKNVDYGKTITILDDITVGYIGYEKTTVGNETYYPLTKSITINLNGNTLTTNQKLTTRILKENADEEGEPTLTIKNGTLNAKNVTATGALFNPRKDCSVIVDKAVIDTNGSALYPQGDAAKVKVINGSKIHAAVYAVATNAASADNYGVEITLKDSEFDALNTTDKDNCPVLINVEGTLNIDKCTISGDRQAVVVRAGTAEIRNSNIVNSCEYVDSHKYENDEAWGQGNEVPMAALLVGNAKSGSYNADAIATVTNTKIESKDNKPAIFIDDNSDHKAVLDLSGKTTDVIGDITKKASKNNASKLTINGGTYSDLSAVDYLGDGANVTIKLEKNIELDKAVVIPEGKTVTIDLNGHNMTTTAAVDNIINNGTLTIKDSGENGSIISSKAGAISALLNNPGATAVIKSGTLSKTADHYVITNHGTLTIDGGKITSTSTKSSAIENGWYTPSDNTNKVNSILTINDGTVENTGTTANGGLYTLKNDDYGIMYINGGTFTNTTDGAGALLNWNEATITGGVFNAKNVAVATMAESSADNASIPKYDFEKGITTITGGTFNAGFGTLSAYKDTIKVRVTGGTFVSIPDAYIVDGYEKKANDNGTFTVSRIYSGGGAVVPPTTDNVTNDTTEKNTTADLTPAVSDNKSTTTVDNATADKIVDKAVANKSTEVIVDATGNNTVASSEVGIPEKTVKELAEKTDASLVIKTDNGKVDLDKTAVKALADQAGTTGTVKLIVETVKNDADICHVNLKLITSNGAVTDFRGGNVKVTINLDKELAAKELVCVYIDDNGIYTLVEGVLNADGTYTFTTGHFSEYAVMAKAEADKKIAEQLNTLIKEVNLKVRTSKTAKKNIKAVVSGDITALTDAGYTVKYKFYRSTKKASKYVSKGEKTADTYINTAGKKGTKYYYKAKAMVYSGDTLVGKTVLKQCKYGVRTWSK